MKKNIYWAIGGLLIGAAAGYFYGKHKFEAPAKTAENTTESGETSNLAGSAAFNGTSQTQEQRMSNAAGGGYTSEKCMRACMQTHHDYNYCMGQCKNTGGQVNSGRVI